MRDARSTRSATALRALNAALLVGLGASLAVVAPEMRARLAPDQPTATSVATSPPPSAATDDPRRQEVSILPPLLGGDSVARVIANNRGMLQTCYERALSRDASIRRSKITIRVIVGISGRVRHVKTDAAPRFRAIEPCLRESLSRWVFPRKGEPYATEFALIVP